MTRIRFHTQPNIAGRQRGVLLIAVLVIALTLTTIGIALMSYVSGLYGLSVQGTYRANAILVAEAGIETSLHQLNADNTFTGYSTDQVFFDNADQGHGVYTTVIQNTANSNARTITSTGTIYRYGTTTNPVSTRKIRVTVVGTASPGYSVQTGPGGLILGGSANITNSDVFVNGYIQMNGASRIGTAGQPLNVYVANDQCPQGSSPGSTYPQVCSSGVQPITMAYSTNIYGTVCATGQTSTGPNNNIQGGSTGQGLKPGCTAAPVQTPTYDRASQISAVTTTASGMDNTYVCNSYPFNRTWPAHLELTGNVSIAGSCNLVIKGDVYITGNLTLGGAAKITVDDSVGTTRPNVLVDGTITTGGSAQLVSNSSGTGIRFISAKSSASCNPNCTSLSGNDLKNSQTVQTVSIGGATSSAGMIFQSLWGKVTLSGSGNVGSAIGQTVDLSGAGTVTFGTTLSSGSTTWTISSYQRL